MSKKDLRNPLESENESMIQEIKDQDLDNQAVGAGAKTAIKMTQAGKCGHIFTFSYECSPTHKRCG